VLVNATFKYSPLVDPRRPVLKRQALFILWEQKKGLEWSANGLSLDIMRAIFQGNLWTKGQHEKRDTLKLILSKRSIVNANPDISLGLPFSHVAEFVKTGDMLTLCNNYHTHFIKNPGDVVKLEKFFEKYPIAV